MKHSLSLIALSCIALTLIGCAGPAVRHDVRVDRRTDAAGRVDDRVTNRQDNRYDRRDDRRDRVDYRYGY